MVGFDVDVLRDGQWDVLKERDGIFKLLLSGAAAGWIAGIMSSPPNTSSYELLLGMMVVTEKWGRRAARCRVRAWISRHNELPLRCVCMVFLREIPI